SLGLASREGYLDAGQEGSFEVRLSYDGQPTRLYDTGVTPFRGVGPDVLGLPADWVAAGSTAGMSQLRSSLVPVDLGFDRRTVALLGKLNAASSWTVFGELRHQEKIGTDFTSASFLTQGMQLPEPIDYITNSFDAGVAWAGRGASLKLTYTGSWFEDQSDELAFANPYLPFVPGSMQGSLALPPSNTLQQLALAGHLELPWSTTLTFDASSGHQRQDAAFLPASTLPGATAPVQGSLDGDVHLSHYALGLASRPLAKLSLRGHASYDGRDDATTPLTINYVVTDTFPGGAVVTPRYGEDRVRLDGGADYSLWRWLRVGVGGELKEIHYNPGQLLAWSQDAQSWGRASITPIGSLTLMLKGGNALRKTSPFNSAALPLGENPLIAPFNYASRDRVFYDLTATWSILPSLTWTLDGFLADDDYRLSSLGLQSAHERRGSTSLDWSPRESLSLHADAGYQRLSDLQNGYTGAVTPPWLVSDAERFWNAGVGAEWRASHRWNFKLDYLHAPSYADTDIAVSGSAQAFPQIWTRLDSATLRATYQLSSALEIRLRYTFDTFNSTDWALGGVGPATVPNLLALGLQPYQHHVNLVALTASYQFGKSAATASN
ncbi:MAG TPA: MtrB/PioB family decaheme-associated outer membrane protein, partial [Steroidobacteraceae bacterium]|nr:MtrB/PioB family decaheme-associated outer membrane protein [Steroidobacteraceae bacterium]